MMIIHIKNGHLSIDAQVVCGNGIGIEITKPAKGLAFGMVTGRTNQSICQSLTIKNMIGSCKGAINSPFCCKVGVAVQGSKRVKTVITCPDEQFFWGAGGISNGEYIWVNRFIRFDDRTYLFKIVYKL